MDDHGLDALIQIASAKRHPDKLAARRFLAEQGYGKTKETVEVDKPQTVVVMSKEMLKAGDALRKWTGGASTATGAATGAAQTEGRGNGGKLP